jgi:indolepyruvate ferredoxin oxidoreductase
MSVAAISKASPDVDNVPPPSVVDGRYEQTERPVFLTGIQALIRMMVEQIRRDASEGLRIGGFVTGYPGSPLGGMEGALGAARATLKRYGIHHVPGQNEELAATSLMGTQMIDEHPHPDHDGVIGFWYGKGPGVDRSGDAMKHGNFAGTSKNGAVVILSGEDHEAKSSTVPYQQDFAFEHYGMPVLYPATVREFVEFGLHAIALSRYSGCWVALKLTAPVCDGGATFSVQHAIPDIVIPDYRIDGKPFSKIANFRFFPGFNIKTERELYNDRHGAVRAYARANQLDKITIRSAGDRIGIIAAGKTYTDTFQALRELGWTEASLEDAGIRVLKLGLLCPIDPEIIREFADGLDEIIVIEEKRDFIERQVGKVICNLPKVPKLVGKLDLDGAPLFPVESGFDKDFIAGILGSLLADHMAIPSAGLSRLAEVRLIQSRGVVEHPRRTSAYCSGCPHNIGTKTAPGQVAWGVPGCHIFAAIMPAPRSIDAVMQFGGDGLPWIGLSPFTTRKHIIQNVGDGSLFHSSYLNIRYAISTGVTMTFKILYNGAIANTGGQPPVGQRSVPQLAQLLLIEGVKRLILVAKERKRYKRGELPGGVEIRDPGEIEDALKELEATQGVTVLIYDGECANERRRRQKRGLVPKPTTFTLVNEDVCENCGHCGTVSNCMSLQKAPTEFGAKTVIHQSSCNQDMTCLTAECPSFVTVQTQEGKALRKPIPISFDQTIPQPVLPALDRPYHICMPGVGGTGVITVNAILAQAVSLDGNRALTFDLTGASQKWGPVLSSLIIAPPNEPVEINNVGLGQANLYLALDLLAASDRLNLMRCSPERTAAVINAAALPTAEMVRNVDLKLASGPMIATIENVTDPTRTITIDARTIAEGLFGDYMMTNMVAIGVAYQAGLLPVSAESIEEAIRLNNVHQAANIAAFRAGRLVIHQPNGLDAMLPSKPLGMASRIDELQLRPSARREADRDALLRSFDIDDKETLRLLHIRIEDLIDYQGTPYARRFVEIVRRAIAAESRIAAAGNRGEFVQAVVKNLHKLMAYKDEYEVARLLTQRTFDRRAKSMFDGPVRLKFHLQPPLLRHFGIKQKLAVGEWIVPVLRFLRSLRFLRGTPFDIFGYSSVRRQERELIKWYAELLDRVIPEITRENYATAVAIANLPDEIRGYESIKEKSIVTTKARVATLMTALRPTQADRLVA